MTRQVMEGVEMSDENPNTDEQQQSPQPDTAPANSGQPDGDTISLPKAAFNDRLARAKQAAVNELLEQFGVSSVDDIKGWQTAAQQQADAKKAAQTQTEQFEAKLAEQQKQIEQLRQANEQATKAAQEAESKRRLALRNGAIRKAAANAHDPDDIIRWAEAAGKFEGVMGEDGSVDEDAVNKLVDAARQEKPHLFKSGPGSPSNNNGRGLTKEDQLKRLGDKPLVRF